MNNTQKTLKNSIFSVFAQMLTMLLGLINRRLFIRYLDITLLGYTTLYSNIFSLLSVAELGINEIVTFHLYKEVVNKNYTEIGKLITLYKWMYRCVAITIIILGGLCYFSLPMFVREIDANWSFLHAIYFLQLTGIVLGYCLSYRRSIYFVTQREYECIKLDILVRLGIEAIKIIALVCLKNFWIYFVIELSAQVIINILITIKSNKDYPYLKNKYNVSIEDIRKRNLFSDLSNFLVHSVCGAVYFGIDSIIISVFSGIKAVAMYGNYRVISNAVTQLLLQKCLNPIKATIGNIVYGKRDKKELWEQFRMLDMFSFFYSTYISLGFLIFYQPFMEIWMGKDLLLPFSFVVLYSLTVYAGAINEIVYKYRSVFGDYKNDRNFMIAAAISNIFISIIGAMLWGVTGVQFGTLVAFFFIGYGRCRFVIRCFFKHSLKEYFKLHFIYILLAIVEGMFCSMLCFKLPLSFFGFVLRFMVWITIPGFINIVSLYKNPYLWSMLHMLSRLIER